MYQNARLTIDNIDHESHYYAYVDNSEKLRFRINLAKILHYQEFFYGRKTYKKKKDKVLSVTIQIEKRAQNSNDTEDPPHG